MHFYASFDRALRFQNQCQSTTSYKLLATTYFLLHIGIKQLVSKGNERDPVNPDGEGRRRG